MDVNGAGRAVSWVAARLVAPGSAAILGRPPGWDLLEGTPKGQGSSVLAAEHRRLPGRIETGANVGKMSQRLGDAG